MSVGVMTVGVMSVREITVGVMTVVFLDLLSLLGTRLLTNLVDAKAVSCNTEVNFSAAVEQSL
jgi:hypothetical protein